MSQNTLVFQQRSPVQSLMGLSRQIALPHEFAPERFPSFPALERTAVMGFNTPATLALPANTAVRALVARQAAYPLWADVPMASESYSLTYHSGLANDLGAPLGIEVFRGWTGAGTVTTVTPVLSGVIALATGYPIVGLDSGTGPLPWLWVPAGATLTLIGVANDIPLVSADFTVTLEVWVQPGECATYKNRFSSTCSGVARGLVLGIDIPATGIWVRPAGMALDHAISPIADLYLTLCVHTGTSVYVPSAANGGTFAVTPSTITAFLPLVAPSEYANSSLPWSSTRTTAAAALFTNVSQVLNKAGTVLCGRVAPQRSNPFNSTTAQLTALHPAEKAYLALEHGAYTYCPPSTDMQEFFDYTCPQQLGGGPTAPVYRLDNTSLVNVLIFTAGSVAETIAVNLDWHFEFRTTSALFQIGMSALTLESLHQAQLSLAAVGFFFPNESHLAVLKSVIPRVIAFAKRYLPAMQLLPGHAGLASRAAVAAGNVLLSAKPRATPPATSGRGSGISGAKARPTVSTGKKRVGRPVVRVARRRAR